MKAWHFAPDSGHLRYAPETPETLIVPGRTFRVDPEKLHACNHGLHASARITDALRYAPGSTISRVTLGGKIVRRDNKLVASERTHISVLPATMGDTVLRDFARRCALDAIHLWDAPDVVLRYLRTGDDALRTVARDAVRDAVRGAAWDASWGVARDAAWAAARDAAWDATWDAAGNAAWDAAWAAGWAAGWEAPWGAARETAKDKQNRRLTSMVVAAMRNL